jgi:hypothetical protein
MPVIAAPSGWVEAVSEHRLPPKIDRCLEELMERNTEGELTEEERADLESLVEMSEALSLMRAQALQLLGRKPQ